MDLLRTRATLAFLIAWAICLSSLGCDEARLPAQQNSADQKAGDTAPTGPELMVLGIAQDAGYPQAGCQKDCCRAAWTDHALRRHPVCLALVEPTANGAKRFLIECTPEFREQLRMLDEAVPIKNLPGLDGILLTHAHIGHYAGLIELGREVMGTKNVPVFAMPRMKAFLENNGPWSQLVSLENIRLQPLTANEAVKLTDSVSVTPIPVPHRDEYSETVAYVIAGPTRRVLFLPDIDKWDRWDHKIEDMIASVDIAYIDGSFFNGDEIPGRDLSEIPHPFVIESLERFASLPAETKARIRFIHFNHTNDALRPQSAAAQAIRAAGFRIAAEGEREAL